MGDAAKKADRIIWGDYDSGEIIVTEQGGIGIALAGMVFMKPLREWHELANRAYEAEAKKLDQSTSDDMLGVAIKN